MNEETKELLKQPTIHVICPECGSRAYVLIKNEVNEDNQNLELKFQCLDCHNHFIKQVLSETPFYSEHMNYPRTKNHI